MDNLRITILSLMIVVAVFTQEYEVFTEGKRAVMFPRTFGALFGKRLTGNRIGLNTFRMGSGIQKAYGINDWNEYIKDNDKRMDMKHYFVGLGRR
uniref:Uncharacterized protein n=1 Tax=Haemonchus contortus TaxID=6289 RepID=A0A7I4Z3B4_HAECO|nr:unnamed protein product [Haemonchus contortus]